MFSLILNQIWSEFKYLQSKLLKKEIIIIKNFKENGYIKKLL